MDHAPESNPPREPTPPGPDPAPTAKLPAISVGVGGCADTAADVTRPDGRPSPGAGASASEHAPRLPEELPGTRVGRYQILARLGEGGFGTVYRAVQEHPVRREVALKVIKLGMDTREVVARFEAERQALAMMDHPNIAKVLDAGATAAGRPYFVMELVRGAPITQYCDERRLGMRQRVELFCLVCRAVQHAHAKGIIHRDIKPSNVLVGESEDGTPVPKVIDFGIAKATGGRLTERTLFTEVGQFIGTPEYMSPEQAGLAGVDVDTRSDVYSLGVLLYQLLTGTTPFDAKVLRSKAYDEIRRMIRDVDAPAPSTRLLSLGGALARVADQRATDPRRLGRAVRGELDWIAMRAMEKDRDRRYETASALAEDVQRYLNQEAVLASPPSAAYRARKFVRRHRAGVAAAAAAVAAVGVVAALVLYGAAREARQREQNIVDLTDANARTLEQRRHTEEAKLVADEKAAVADDQRTLALDTLNSLVGEVQVKLDRPGLAPVQQSILNIALDGLQRIDRSVAAAGAVADQKTATVQLKLGDLFDLLAQSSEARARYASAHQTFVRLARENPSSPLALHDRFASCERLGSLDLRLGKVDDAAGHYGEMLDAANAQFAADRSRPEAKRDLCVAYGKMGDLCLDQLDPKSAKVYYASALTALMKLEGGNPARAEAKRELSFAHRKLGSAFLMAGPAAGSKRYFRESHRLLDEIHRANPESGQAALDLSYSYDLLGALSLQLGDAAEANHWFGRALEWVKTANPPEGMANKIRSLAYEGLGELNLQRDRLDDAENYYKSSLHARSAVADADPTSARARREVSIAHDQLGDVSQRRGKTVEAKWYFAKSLDLREDRRRSDPGGAEAMRDVLAAYNRLAAHCMQFGDVDGARAYLRHGLGIARALAPPGRATAQANMDLWKSYIDLAYADERLGEQGEALEYYGQAVPAALAVMTADPSIPEGHRELWVSHSALGELYEELDRFDQAATEYQSALEPAEARTRGPAKSPGKS